MVALQESSITRRSGDAAARIAQALGLVHVHARERVFPPRVHGRLIVGALGFVEGPAILSRFPSVATEVYDLPRGPRWIDPWVALRADIQTPASVVAVFSTHTPRDDCQTRREAELAGESNGRPAVVMGRPQHGRDGARARRLPRSRIRRPLPRRQSGPAGSDRVAAHRGALAHRVPAGGLRS